MSAGKARQVENRKLSFLGQPRHVFREQLGQEPNCSRTEMFENVSYDTGLVLRPCRALTRLVRNEKLYQAFGQTDSLATQITECGGPLGHS